jgi:hypothetical protein
MPNSPKFLEFPPMQKTKSQGQSKFVIEDKATGIHSGIFRREAAPPAKSLSASAVLRKAGWRQFHAIMMLTPPDLPEEKSGRPRTDVEKWGLFPKFHYRRKEEL